MYKYFIWPGGQVGIVAIYLTSIYECCQLIDLELKMIIKTSVKEKKIGAAASDM